MITYEQTELLLKSYKTLVALADNHKIQLNILFKERIKGNEADEIEGETFHGQDLSTIGVNSGKVSDPTAWIALNYRKALRFLLRDSEKLLWAEVTIASNLIKKVNNALDALDKRERQIIEVRTMQGHAWKQTRRICGQSREWLSKLKARAIRNLSMLIVLDEDERKMLIKYEKAKSTTEK